MANNRKITYEVDFNMFQMEESDELFDVVIRYGLYLVAVCQLICITTVFLLTDQSNDQKVCYLIKYFIYNWLKILIKKKINI